MTKPLGKDPYMSNILVQGLGPILSRDQVLSRLTCLPPLPGDMSSMPKHYRMHALMAVRDFYFPSLEGARVLETTELMMRQGYRYRDPTTSETWAMLSNEPTAALKPRAPAMAAMVVGNSGVGKTTIVQKALACYPSQVVVHESFPRLKGSHYQMVYQSVDVPGSGKEVDLAENLMISWDNIIEQTLSDEPYRFAKALSYKRRDGPRMLNEWRQVAKSHFLGVLHLDEVQNFFKIPSLERRRKGKASKLGEGDVAMELSIIEDQALKAVLTMTNTWQIPIIFSGTPDGVGALTKRLSNTQRFVTSGYHRMSEFQSATDPNYVSFMAKLGEYQYVVKRLELSRAIFALVFQLTGGIHRLIIALWIAAHRLAFERTDDDLRLEDFELAARTYLAPVGPAVAALLSKDPSRMRHYEDLMPRDDGFWVTFWTGTRSL